MRGLETISRTEQIITITVQPWKISRNESRLKVPTLSTSKCIDFAHVEIQSTLRGAWLSTLAPKGQVFPRFFFPIDIAPRPLAAWRAPLLEQSPPHPHCSSAIGPLSVNQSVYMNCSLGWSWPWRILVFLDLLSKSSHTLLSDSNSHKWWHLHAAKCPHPACPVMLFAKPTEAVGLPSSWTTSPAKNVWLIPCFGG